MAIVAAALLAPPGRAAAWTPATQQSMVTWAARIAPPDLRRQIARHEDELRAGVLAPFTDEAPQRHVAEPAAGELRATIVAETARAIEMIRSHRRFEEIVFQLGVVSHFVADAHNPLDVASADPEEPRYYADYQRYTESAQDRFTVVFYGLQPDLESPADFERFVERMIADSRRFYTAVGREYRRVGFAEGRHAFDDRSTAFGVAAVSFSQAVTDISTTLRYIWIQAGGADPRSALPVRAP